MISKLLKYALYSRFGYFDDITIKELHASLNQHSKPIKKINNDGAFCWIFEEDEETVVSFRGTDSLGDALYNLKFFRSPYGQLGHVHTGYLNYYKLLQDDVREVLKDRAKSQITFVGHSMGGVCGTLGAIDIYMKRNELGLESTKLACYTYGAPAIGDKTFCANVEKIVPRYYRVINEADIAPFISEKANSHVSKRVIKIGNPKPPIHANELARTLYSIHQHNIERYIYHLRRLKQKPPNSMSIEASMGAKVLKAKPCYVKQNIHTCRGQPLRRFC